MDVEKKLMGSADSQGRHFDLATLSSLSIRLICEGGKFSRLQSIMPTFTEASELHVNRSPRQ